MRNITIALLSLSCLVCPLQSYAQEVEAEPTPWYENNDQVSYQDNTGALGGSSGDTAADIVNEANEDMAGALKGEITLRKREDIVEVYSNGNLVEQIVRGTGGTGEIVSENSGTIVFKPAGRPDLNCPAQATAGWFGPCKVEESSAS